METNRWLQRGARCSVLIGIFFLFNPSRAVALPADYPLDEFAIIVSCITRKNI